MFEIKLILYKFEEVKECQELKMPFQTCKHTLITIILENYLSSYFNKRYDLFLWVHNTKLFCHEAFLKTQSNGHHHYHYI